MNKRNFCRLERIKKMVGIGLFGTALWACSKQSPQTTGQPAEDSASECESFFSLTKMTWNEQLFWVAQERAEGETPSYQVTRSNLAKLNEDLLEQAQLPRLIFQYKSCEPGTLELKQRYWTNEAQQYHSVLRHEVEQSREEGELQIVLNKEFLGEASFLSFSRWSRELKWKFGEEEKTFSFRFTTARDVPPFQAQVVYHSSTRQFREGLFSAKIVPFPDELSIFGNLKKVASDQIGSLEIRMQELSLPIQCRTKSSGEYSYRLAYQTLPRREVAGEYRYRVSLNLSLLGELAFLSSDRMLLTIQCRSGETELFSVPMRLYFTG